MSEHERDLIPASEDVERPSRVGIGKPGPGAPGGVGQVGRIVTGFKDCLGETQTRQQIEARLTTMVQSRMISPDVAQMILDTYETYPKTITMDVIKAAWEADNAPTLIKWQKARERVMQAAKELQEAELEERRLREQLAGGRR